MRSLKEALNKSRRAVSEAKDARRARSTRRKKPLAPRCCGPRRGRRSSIPSGWAFRLTVFGAVFCWGFFTWAPQALRAARGRHKVFLGRRLEDVLVRTYGRLYQAKDGALTFKFKPWLVLKEREVALPREGIVVGRGVFYSEVLGHNTTTDNIETLLLLPPRYVGHEELFARTYHISSTTEVGLRKAWSWLKETLGFGKKSHGARGGPGVSVARARIGSQ